MPAKYLFAPFTLALLLLVAPQTDAQYVRGVPYFNQNHNQIDPSGSCQNSIAAMLLNYYGAETVTPDAISRRWGTSKAQTVNGWEEVFNTEARERGLSVRDQGVDNGRLSAVRRLLDQGQPVGVHGGFTRSGHLIVLLGYDDEYYYVHDPYGDWSKDYSGTDSQAGRHARYPRQDVDSAIRDLFTGYVRYHAFASEPAPLAVAWAQSPPDSAVSGVPLQLAASVRLEAGEQPRLTADLSQLGGSREAALTAIDGDVYRLEENLDLTGIEPGWKQVVVAAEQAVGGAVRITRLAHTIAILAPRDQPIFADGWGANWAPGLVLMATLDPASRARAHSGETSLAFAADYYNATLLPAAPIGPVGYEALRFAFHPGDVVPEAKSAFSVYVNDDNRTLVKLLGNADSAPLIDLGRREWQVVEIPLQRFTWPERPIETLHLFGKLRGTFYLDDVRLVAARPCPVAASWARVSVDSAVVGTALDLELAVRLDRLDPSGQSPRLTADLSALGGPADAPLISTGDSTYHLRSTLALPEFNGLRQVRVRVEQTVGAATRAMELRRPLVLLPAADLPIFADGFAAPWQVGYARSAELDTAAHGPVFEGGSSLAVRAANFTVEWLTTFPVEPAGFRALRLAFHPGEVVADPGAAFNLFVNGDPRTAVQLLPKDGTAGYIDMDQATWQVAEIPLTAFGDFEGPIHSLRILGNLQGTFYLDDVRLLAASPPAAPTAVSTDPPRPQTPALSRNYPNPFNSSTTIPFSLSAPSSVRIVIHNLTGQQVRTLTSSPFPSGTHALHWDGRDQQGRDLASGLYLYQLRAGDLTRTRKMLLLR